MKSYASPAVLDRQPHQPHRWLAALWSHSAVSSYLAPAAYLFLYIYNISFLAVPSATSGRVILLLLTAGYWPRIWAEVRHFAVENVPALFSLVFLLFYSVLLYALSGFVDSTQVSRSLNLLLYTFFGSLVFAVVVDHDVRRFAVSFALATLIQTALIGLSYVSADYRIWLSRLVVQSGNIALTSALQVPGFSNSSGALLSTIQSLGVFAALYCAKSTHSLRARLLWTLAGIPIAVSTIVTGRTGLMLAVMFAGVFLFVGNAKQRLTYLGLGLVIAAAALAVAGSVFSVVSEANPQAERLSSWAFEIFQRGTDASSWQDLLSQPIPPLTFDRLFGTGLVVAQDGIGNASGNDSGYIQTYFALGLLMTVVFYVVVALLLGKYCWRSRDQFLFAVLLGLLFVIEIKEPFIYKYVYPFLILTFAYLSSRQNASSTVLIRAPRLPS